jgi:hypothetical protein
VNDANERLGLLGDVKFDPRRVAYVETGRELPAPPYEGTARIESETPTRIVVAAEMKTPGVLVLPDLYYPGWKATIDGKPAEILPANHAVRGVVVPAGVLRVEFRYEPGSFKWGARLAVVALVVLGIQIVIAWRRMGGMIPTRRSNVA